MNMFILQSLSHSLTHYTYFCLPNIFENNSHKTYFSITKCLHANLCLMPFKSMKGQLWFLRHDFLFVINSLIEFNVTLFFLSLFLSFLLSVCLLLQLLHVVFNCFYLVQLSFNPNIEGEWANYTMQSKI